MFIVLVQLLCMIITLFSLLSNLFCMHNVIRIYMYILKNWLELEELKGD